MTKCHDLVPDGRSRRRGGKGSADIPSLSGGTILQSLQNLRALFDHDETKISEFFATVTMGCSSNSHLLHYNRTQQPDRSRLYCFSGHRYSSRHSMWLRQSPLLHQQRGRRFSIGSWLVDSGDCCGHFITLITLPDCIGQAERGWAEGMLNGVSHPTMTASFTP